MIEAVSKLAENQLFAIRQQPPHRLLPQIGEKAARGRGRYTLVKSGKEHALRSAAGISERTIAVLPQVRPGRKIVDRPHRIVYLERSKVFSEQNGKNALPQVVAHRRTEVRVLLRRLQPFPLAQWIHYKCGNTVLRQKDGHTLVFRRILACTGMSANLYRSGMRSGETRFIRQIEIPRNEHPRPAFEKYLLYSVSVAPDNARDFGVEGRPLRHLPDAPQHLPAHFRANGIKFLNSLHFRPDFVRIRVKSEQAVVVGRPRGVLVVWAKSGFSQN